MMNMANFENYEKQKGFWFWMMLTIGSLVSSDSNLSVKKGSLLVEDFIDSNFYHTIFKDRPSPIKNFKQR